MAIYLQKVQGVVAVVNRNCMIIMSN